MTSISFSVSYTLGEYLSILQDHVPTAMARLAERGEARNAHPAGVRIALAVIATKNFISRKRRAPVCDFVIDELRIRRTSAEGRVDLRWRDVVAVHRYSRGYLIEKGEGAVALPYRCFSAEQAMTMSKLVERHNRRR